MESWLLIQIIFIPMAAGVLIFAIPSSNGRHAGWITISSLIYTSLLLGWTGRGVLSRGTVLETWKLGPDMGLNLLADGLSLPIAFVVNIICLGLAFYSLHYVDHRIHVIYCKDDSGRSIPEKSCDKHLDRYRKRFFFLYLFFPTGFMGVLFCTNLLALYLFLEVLTIIPLYFIMAQFGYSDYITRYRVALICLFWGVAGASLFFIGILMGYDIIGSFEIDAVSRLSGHHTTFWIILLILAGLCAKLAVFPLHVWMPWVHAEHPTCIAGLLAVYANIAVYILVRVLILPLPEDIRVFQIPLMGLAMVTMVYGALLTLAQTDVKRFCACSTISQISYSVFGVMTLTPLGIQGGLFYFLSHILGKAILFSSAGIIVYRTGTRDMRKMGGLWRKMPLTAILWMTAALVLSALPPTAGFVGKWLFFTGGFQAFKTSEAGIFFLVSAILSTLLTLVYTFKTGIGIFFGPFAPPLDSRSTKLKDPPVTMWLPLVFLAILALGLGLFPGPILHLLGLGT